MTRVVMKPDEYQTVGTESEKGSSTQLSPYDIPREASTNVTGGVLNIYFKYLDDEDSVPKIVNDHLKMEVGKYSGKILSLEVNIANRDMWEVAAKLATTLESEGQRQPKFNQRANHEVIGKVLKSSLRPLLSVNHP